MNFDRLTFFRVVALVLAFAGLIFAAVTIYSGRIVPHLVFAFVLYCSGQIIYGGIESQIHRKEYGVKYQR